MPLPASRAGRSLVAVWAAVMLAAAGMATTLQWLGPPQHLTAPGVVPNVRTPATAGSRPEAPAAATSTSPVGPKPPPARERLDIPAPEAALLEPVAAGSGMMLPRIASDGREARSFYAARTPVLPPGAKRISILLEGIGLSAADSLDAIDQLPGAISLAVSPYAVEPAAILDAARKAGHELLLSLPMEPASAPFDDEGGKALTARADASENMARLLWSLSRVEGYAGVTNAHSGLDGRGFANSPQFAGVAHALAGRGLFYLDATPDDPLPGGIARVGADLRLDDPPAAADIDRQLARLEQIAGSRGSAIGVAGPLYPVTIRRLAEWARALPSHGLVLVPVSSLVRPPPEPALRSVP